MPDDVADVTDAADRLEARLPDEVERVPAPRVYTFAELISAADKEKLLEFGRHII